MLVEPNKKTITKFNLSNGINLGFLDFLLGIIEKKII